MTKFKEGLEVLKLKLRVTELEEKLREMTLLLEATEDERDVLAAKLVKGSEFGDWLMEQDTSSMLRYRSTAIVSGVRVEGADDLKLALAFCRRRAG